jgi:hypothetical protein
MMAPRSRKPSTSDVVLGITLPVIGFVMLVDGVVGIAAGDPSAAFALIVAGLLLIVHAPAFLSEYGSPGDSPSFEGRGFFARIKAFFGERRRTAAGKIKITHLPADIVDPIRPLLPKTRYITPAQLRALYAQATELLIEQTRHAQQQRETIEVEAAHARAQAHAIFLATLSDEQRALLELHLQTKADADARAARHCERTERLIADLRRALAETQEEHEVVPAPEWGTAVFKRWS